MSRNKLLLIIKLYFNILNLNLEPKNDRVRHLSLDNPLINTNKKIDNTGLSIYQSTKDSTDLYKNKANIPSLAVQKPINVDKPS
ncbi:MAG: hypothetical protein ACTSW1_12075 [Candidatus Hodarchaeales archaeon]